jgi:hypothetical protein
MSAEALPLEVAILVGVICQGIVYGKEPALDDPRLA